MSADPYQWLHDNEFSWDDVNAIAAILDAGGFEIRYERPNPDPLTVEPPPADPLPHGRIPSWEHQRLDERPVVSDALRGWVCVALLGLVLLAAVVALGTR